MYRLLLVQMLHCCFLVAHSCPTLCTCVYLGGSNGTGLRSVLCSEPRMSAIPLNAPADTVKFRLEKTSISRVPRAAFFYLSELQFLWLTYNSITTIHPSSFLNLKVLRELRLDGNLLSAFPWEGLRDMPRLRTLGLHNNRLSSLPAHAALFLPNVTYLDLSSNRLTTLPSELLDLWFPPPAQLTGPTQRRVLGVHDNMWQCDCQISMLLAQSKYQESPVVLMDQLLTCSRSGGTADQLGAPLTEADLSRCQRPSVQPSATRVTSPLGSNVMLRCDATGYPTPVLTWTKAAGASMYNTVLQESPRVGIRWSIINLNGLSYKDAGEYRCQARNMAGTAEAPIRLRVVGVVPPSIKSKTRKAPSRSSTSNRKPLPQKPKRAQNITSISTSKKKTLLNLKYVTPPTPTNKTQSIKMAPVPIPLKKM
ncbi:leucine-rich repeat, immunoglobulin-like domain and transmembrane domain-containing protein 3b [Oncorhynchus tshawytscha]|uniref:leucine-rich repeat, immunoglobulin-like domain and transmembrane domain-containing protein 3b n=1 Tax=Oncorhynchus tshawytscha TaxID=74940 RepID=UPI000D0A0664|nr:leucine-rich repeat, immunoglobulin-like domain and transmembrane domain-containing protein 3b [Oncorhynchus tshawytscha]